MYSLPTPDPEVLKVPVVFLVGQAQIAEFCHVSERTISRWVLNYSFPQGMLPNGDACASSADISLWARARMHQPKKTMKPLVDEESKAVA